MKKLLLVSLLSSPVMASDWVEESWSKSSVTTSFNNEQVWSAKIRHAKNSTQRLFFFYERRGQSPCNPLHVKSEAIWRVNDQPIQVYQWCKKYQDTDRYYFYATAKTDIGDSFIVNSFRYKNYVYVESDSDFRWKVNLSAKGFTKAWDSFGGNAL